jgi:UDP-N-acetyl-D-glucosamine dehydrogenase
MSLVDSAIERFQDHSARVAILGLGYAGLPLALTFAERGFRTVGLDIDEEKIAKLRRGESYIRHIASNRLAELLRGGRFEPKADFDSLAECDAAIICVPTPLGPGREPDLRFVVDSAEAVADHLHPGQLVVLESTTYPGTTDEVVLPVLAQTGLSVGDDFFLAFSPEREDPANREYSTKTIAKIVGGVTHNCGKVAASAYGEVVDSVVPVSNARVAEAAKLLENIYRCVNIALVNELKLLFERMEIDIWEVISAASTKPFGFTPFYPGPGLGGHCIPVDPFYLSWKARKHEFWTRFIELAGEINSAMPEHTVRRLAQCLNLRGKALKGSKILLLGAAYKRNVEDVRESPALAIFELLDRSLAQVSYHDPHVPLFRARHLNRDIRSVPLEPEEISSADAVLILTDHDAVDYSLVLRHAQLVVDTRNVTARYRDHNNNVMMA